MTKKKKRFRAFDPDPDSPDRCCDMPDCNEPAGYRAPKSPNKLNEYFWFCFEHVRQYNSRWDFCKGMTPSQIEQKLRSATVWDKPSWKLGGLGSARLLNKHYFKDPMNIFTEANNKTKNTAHHHTETNPIPDGLKDSLKTLELDWPLSLAELKKRYTLLARRYHPDTNGGDVELAEQFKIINAAYSQLRTHLMNTAAV